MRNSKWWQNFHSWQNYPFNNRIWGSEHLCLIRQDSISREDVRFITCHSERERKKDASSDRKRRPWWHQSLICRQPRSLNLKLGSKRACVTLGGVCVCVNVLACDCAWVLTEHSSHCNNKQPLRQGMKERVCVCVRTSSYRMCWARPWLRGSGCSWHWRLL